MTGTPPSSPRESAATPSKHNPSREEHLLRILSGEDKGLFAEITRAGLWLLSPLYGLVIGAYRGMYDVGLLNEVRLPCPVVSIGNLTVGGTGKTGCALALADLLQEEGLRPALLNYGYHAEVGRGPAIVSDGRTVYLNPREAGDEAVMLAENLPGVPVLIGKRRVESGAMALVQFRPDLLLLDDAFQYWRLAKDVELVLINARNPWGHGAILPRGLMREMPSALRRASALLLTHTDRVSGQDLRSLETDLRRLNPRAPIFHGNYRSKALRSLGAKGEAPLEAIRGARVGALSGLGSPADFEATLRELGASEVHPYRFSDHHSYGSEEIGNVLTDARARRLDRIVTTEKDAVKLEQLNLSDPSLQILVLKVQFRIEPLSLFRPWLLERLTKAGLNAPSPLEA